MTINKPPVSEPDSLRSLLERMRERIKGVHPFVLGVLATLLALILFNSLFPNRQMTEREVRNVVDSALASATPRIPYAVQVYENVKLSVVVVEVKGKGGDGFGAGVIIDDQGSIITSNHVVADSSNIMITFPDGSQSGAFILSATPEQDIAVLRAFNTPALIIPATLGNPGSVRVGDDVFVIGHPFGLTGSLSAGVVSGFDRSFRPSGGGASLKGLIQFDAAANPGNSGGPLLDRYGRVIGIVTGIISPKDDSLFAGVGFAVPITIVASGGTGAPPY
jgi:S1-C subfamily serine protease